MQIWILFEPFVPSVWPKSNILALADPTNAIIFTQNENDIPVDIFIAFRSIVFGTVK